MPASPVDWNGQRWKRAVRIGAIFLLVSAAWIYFSDLAVERLVPDPAEVRRIQTWKGWGFVLASAFLIVYLVQREIGRVEHVAARLDVLLQQSLAGIYLVRSGRFLFVNRTLAGIFGYEPEEMIESLEVADIVAEADRDLVLGNLALREDGKERQLHYRYTGLTKDGEEIRVEVHGARVEWEGEPAVLGIALDVSERERLERQVGQAQKMEALGSLTGQIAHDFNNYLTAIIGPLDLSLEYFREGSDERREVEEARASAMRAADLSRKLLAFSRSRPSVPKTIDANETIREMKALLDRFAGNTVRVELTLARRPVPVRLDPSDLEQVVMNLVLNAVEAVLESGGGRGGRGNVTVRTGHDRPGTESENGIAWIEVEDDGPGMDEETRSRIFEPFFTTKETGTGLGLSSAFGIVEQAGGAVELRTEPGRGTLFRVTLPAAEGEVSRRPRAAPAVRMNGRGERLLVVEDEPAIRRTVSRALERFGYRTMAAGSVSEALVAASDSSARFDLFLTDVQLPDGNGPELATELLRRHPGAAVLFMSGFSDQDISDRLSKLEGVHLVEKPFSVDGLLAAVRRALEDGGAGASRAG